jgi:hypothetical protein
VLSRRHLAYGGLCQWVITLPSLSLRHLPSSRLSPSLPLPPPSPLPGTWKGSLAAVKVMYARQHERQAMKDALEMALLTTVSHPFIIQVGRRDRGRL